MDPVNFTKLNRKSASEKVKQNTTYLKSETKNSFCFQTLKQRAEKYEDFSIILKHIGLTEPLWELYQVNALYDFSYTRVKLFDYQVLLAQNIKKAILDSPVEINLTEIQVQFEKFPETTFTKKDSPALKITITATEISRECTGKCEVIFCGLLLSVDREKGLVERERLEENATILPLLLVQYENKMFLESFIDFLEVNFFCFVSPLKFSTMDLKWILTFSSYPSGEKTNRSTVLEYDTTTDYIIPEQTMQDLFNKVIEPSTQYITKDIVNQFFSKLEHGLGEITQSDLSQHELVGIRTSVGIFNRRDDSVHVFKAYDSNKLYYIMRYLTRFAQEIRSC